MNPKCVTTASEPCKEIEAAMRNLEKSVERIENLGAVIDEICGRYVGAGCPPRSYNEASNIVCSEINRFAEILSECADQYDAALVRL